MIAVVGAFITSQMQMSLVGGISTLFFKWTPSTNTNISSHCHTSFGKRLNILTANVSIFTVTKKSHWLSQREVSSDAQDYLRCNYYYYYYYYYHYYTFYNRFTIITLVVNQ